MQIVSLKSGSHFHRGGGGGGRGGGYWGFVIQGLKQEVSKLVPLGKKTCQCNHAS